MEREVAVLEKGARCCAWNYSGRRLAVGNHDGTVSVHDCAHPASFSGSSISIKFAAHSSGLAKVVWVPPEFGDALACICVDGTVSLWEEIGEDGRSFKWNRCTIFEYAGGKVLDLRFGVSGSNLKLVAAYSDGYVNVYECLDALELSKWHLQAEFHNTINLLTSAKPSCMSASIVWNPWKGESHLESFIVGYSSDLPGFNSAKVWQFDEPHQRWIPVAELALPEDDGDRVHALAWAPNIGRPYEVIAVATCKGIAIWNLNLNPNSDGRLSADKVALLTGHDDEIWQLDWDMSGMTLASTGADGTVRLWQANLNGTWQEQAAFDCNGVMQE